jgi:hypothetical protein
MTTTQTRPTHEVNADDGDYKRIPTTGSVTCPRCVKLAW